MLVVGGVDVMPRREGYALLFAGKGGVILASGDGVDLVPAYWGGDVLDQVQERTRSRLLVLLGEFVHHERGLSSW